MAGYWNRPDETAKVIDKDGWFATGDVGVMDERGFVRIVDRKKDMILVSGFNVYPNEIEGVVAMHPGVLECAAIGVPDEKSGEAVKLFVVKKDPALTAEALMKYCREHLTGYKCPRDVEFRTELPKTQRRQDPAARAARRGAQGRAAGVTARESSSMSETVALPDRRAGAARRADAGRRRTSTATSSAAGSCRRSTSRAAIPASRRARGRVATVAVNSFMFKEPVLVGDVVTFFADVTRIGRTSITVDVEVYAQRNPGEEESR